MRVCFILLFAVTAFLVTGCKSTVCDGRGPSEMCEIHHELMEATEVDNPHMKKAPSQQYLQARVRGFIHSYPFALPEKCDKCVVWICQDCVNAEMQWKAMHPEQK